MKKVDVWICAKIAIVLGKSSSRITWRWCSSTTDALWSACGWSIVMGTQAARVYGLYECDTPNDEPYMKLRESRNGLSNHARPRISRDCISYLELWYPRAFVSIRKKKKYCWTKYNWSFDKTKNMEFHGKKFNLTGVYVFYSKWTHTSQI